MAFGRRLQLFEFEDLPWVPSAVTHGITDFLRLVGTASEAPYREFAKRLSEHMGDDRKIVDLCSGSGGPLEVVVRLMDRLGRKPESILLTDVRPNASNHRLAIEGVDVKMEERSIDARRVPPDLDGFRVIFNAFHHFPPDDATAILQAAVSARRGIAVLEGMDRAPGSIAVSILSLVSMLVVPLIPPFRWGKVFFTWVVPLIPVMGAWDGIVSSLRVYSPEHLRELLANVAGAEDYEWDIGTTRVPFAPTTMTYLVGSPRKVAALATTPSSAS